MPAKKKEQEKQPEPDAAQPNAEAKPEEKPEEKPELERVMWRGKKPPPTNVTIGMLEIKGLPDEAAQRAGFEHEHARELALNLRNYKLDKKKGER